MDLRVDAESLFDPGEAEDFFCAAPGVAFEPLAEEFSSANAYWLAELSRLVYRREAAEGVEREAGVLTRQAHLARVGLVERVFFHEVEACQGALIEEAGGAWSALVFRGTNSPIDWLANSRATLAAWAPGGLAHGGFSDAILAEWDTIKAALEVARGPLFVTGHSLGGALAALAASLRRPHALYTFGSPRVGNPGFAETLGDLPHFRVVNNRDAVTEVPLPLPTLGFVHTGELHYFDHRGRRQEGASGVAVALDRVRWEVGDRAFTDLPKFLTDHAPGNYVALLARLLREEA